MYWLEFIAIIGAAGALVNAWLHKNGLFENYRDVLTTWGLRRPAGYLPNGEASYVYPTLSDTVRAKISQLLQCRVCLTYHVAFGLTVIFFLPTLWMDERAAVIYFSPMYALAATRFSLLIGSVTAAFDIENDLEND